MGGISMTAGRCGWKQPFEAHSGEIRDRGEAALATLAWLGGERGDGGRTTEGYVYELVVRERRRED